MPFDLLAANAVPALSLDLSVIVAIAAVIVTVLLALLNYTVSSWGWVLKREIDRSDKTDHELKASLDAARQELKSDIKQVEADTKMLLTGQARIEATLDARANRRTTSYVDDNMSLGGAKDGDDSTAH